MLLLHTAGQQPTVPTPSTATPLDEVWLATDIMFGEIAVNIADAKVYTRTESGIVELASAGGGGSLVPTDHNATAGTLPANPTTAGQVYRIVLDDPNVPVEIDGTQYFHDDWIVARIDNANQVAANWKRL